MTDPEPDPEPAVGLARAARDDALTAGGLVAAVGGPLGIVESVLPTLVFVVLQQIASIRAAPDPLPRSELLPIALIPLGISIVLLAYRAIRRQPLRTAIGGAVVVAASAALTLVSGDSNNNFVLGFVINAVYLVAILVSLVVRRPLIGILLAALTQDPSWAADRARRRLAARLTVLWSLLFAIRLLVEVPLYAAQASLGLGIARIVLGLPLYAIVLMITVIAVQAARRPRARTV